MSFYFNVGIVKKTAFYGIDVIVFKTVGGLVYRPSDSVCNRLTPQPPAHPHLANPALLSSISSTFSNSPMSGSHEQRVPPEMSASWLDNVSQYTELEGDGAIFQSQDSLECLNWNTQDCGRAESPLRFDHEEVLRIDPEVRSLGNVTRRRRFHGNCMFTLGNRTI